MAGGSPHESVADLTTRNVSSVTNSCDIDFTSVLPPVHAILNSIIVRPLATIRTGCCWLSLYGPMKKLYMVYIEGTTVYRESGRLSTTERRVTLAIIIKLYVKACTVECSRSSLVFTLLFSAINARPWSKSKLCLRYVLSWLSHNRVYSILYFLASRNPKYKPYRSNFWFVR